MSKEVNMYGRWYYRTLTSLVASGLVSFGAWLGWMSYQARLVSDTALATPTWAMFVLSDTSGIILVQVLTAIGILTYALIQLLSGILECHSLACWNVGRRTGWWAVPLHNLCAIARNWPGDFLDALYAAYPEDRDTRIMAIDTLLAQRNQARLSWLRYGLWVLPVSGFIGTVVGVKQAIEPLDTLGAQEARDLSGIIREVVIGLRLAFDTTLVGLLAVIPIMALTVLVRLSGERFSASLQEAGTANRHALVVTTNDAADNQAS
jgi:hypothetical protein